MPKYARSTFFMNDKFVSGETQAYSFYYDGENVAPLDFANGTGKFGSGQTKSDIPSAWTSI